MKPFGGVAVVSLVSIYNAKLGQCLANPWTSGNLSQSQLIDRHWCRRGTKIVEHPFFAQCGAFVFLEIFWSKTTPTNQGQPTQATFFFPPQ